MYLSSIITNMEHRSDSSQQLLILTRFFHKSAKNVAAMNSREVSVGSDCILVLCLSSLS